MIFSAKNFFFPEHNAGGFTRIDGTVQFYTRINALLKPDMRVVDFGAGRGLNKLEDYEDKTWKLDLVVLKGKVQKIIGVDIDESIKLNPFLDEFIVLKPYEKLPFEDQSIDLIVADNTFEHLQDPLFVSKEFSRILKPGGWICARTPNRYGYIGISVNLVPNQLHSKMLTYLQPSRKEKDIFPTEYKINTLNKVKYYFPVKSFKHFSYIWNPEPAYFRNNIIAWGFMIFISKIIPSQLNAMIMIFIQKK